MLIGAHAIIYSRNSDADRAFLRDVLGLPHVEIGGGWLIFGLPPAEVAVHPTEGAGSHELYLMVDDVDAFIASMRERGVACGEVHQQPWGALTEVTLPGGGTLGVYQPRHARPAPVEAPKAKAAKKAARKAEKQLGKKAGKKPGKKPGKKAEKKRKKATKKAAKAEKKAARKSEKRARKAAPAA